MRTLFISSLMLGLFAPLVGACEHAPVELPLKPTAQETKEAKALYHATQKNTLTPTLLEEVQAHAKNLKQQGVAIRKGHKRCVKPKGGLTKGPYERADEMLVFVSLSMPGTLLKSLAKEAATHNGRLIMRGLYMDSFTKTKEKLDQLAITVDIDPTLFEKYEVTRVPTFIHKKPATKEVDRMTGNVSFGYAMAVFGKGQL